MTKFTLEVKSDKDAELIRAILKHFKIQIIEEEIQEELLKSSAEEFYNQFHFDMNHFKFNREEANAR